ncbi:unnamed protein product [Protopolystoma xenopodis]|uniref:Uncharacterized protein n=1 Tax=Protopolystoma xenopodis TaxID=117903 RepID=A0A3S5BDJ4_9PLAT|nr:unnamed protein product [Protopolystoma xenopodis]
MSSTTDYLANFTLILRGCHSRMRLLPTSRSRRDIEDRLHFTRDPVSHLISVASSCIGQVKLDFKLIQLMQQFVKIP